MLADTLVTLRGVPNDAVSILPATTIPEHAGAISKVYLNRKLLLSGPNALAFSGNGNDIRSFCNQFISNLSDPGGHHVVDRLAVAAEEYRNEGRDVAIIAANIPDNLEDGFRQVSNGQSINLKYMNPCTAIGSGASDLLDQCRKYDQSLCSNIQNLTNPVLRANAFAVQLAAKRLAAEYVGDAENAWGGYIEWCCGDPTRHSWRRGPKIVHYFLHAQGNISRNIKVYFVPRIVLYNPGDDVGRILVLAIENKVTFCSEFRMNSVGMDITHKIMGDELDFWANFSPTQGTITIVGGSKGVGFNYATKLITKNILDRFGSHPFTGKFRPNIFNLIAKKFAHGVFKNFECEYMV